jgi:DNA-binding response OmpR family regulator
MENVPFLMLMAKDDVDEKGRGLELLARIQALGRRRRALDLVAVIQVVDLILDKTSRAVRRDGISMALTPRDLVLVLGCCIGRLGCIIADMREFPRADAVSQLASMGRDGTS